MTTQNDLADNTRFVRNILPWLIAAGAAVIYALTFNTWVSFNSVPYVARITGDAWMPELAAGYGPFGPNGPVLFILTYPFRFLPATWVPIALNLFSAICALLVLVLLARSVTLLPHDRTHEQRVRETSESGVLTLRVAWIPPVLAALVCGLQLSFWESATSMSADTLDLLMVAYVIRNLLEYRLDPNDSWLFKGALVYGAAMTSNWFLIVLLPALVVAILWIRGLSFFSLRFLRGMILCGLAGLLLYFLLPVIHLLSESPVHLTLWQSMRMNLAAQKTAILFLVQRLPLTLLLLMALTSFLPVLLLGIRWASYFGDPSKVGIALTTGILHLAHAALLLTCIWVAFDPLFSPRRLSLSVPVLSSMGPVLYYLGALSIGYFAGYFLLVFVPVADRMQRVTGLQMLLYRAAQTAVWTLLILAPVGLLVKNLHAIRFTNGPAVRDYARSLTAPLPSGAVVLSDDSQRLALAQAWMARDIQRTNLVFVDTQSLTLPAYHGYLRNRHGEHWPVTIDPRHPKQIPDVGLVNLMIKCVDDGSVYYLHPSFGYYFEAFYPKPECLAFRLLRHPTNSVSAPPLESAEIAANEEFWTGQEKFTDDLAAYLQRRPGATSPLPLIRKLSTVHREVNSTAAALGTIYSQALNFWGVCLQKSKRLNEANHRLQAAIALNPANLAAIANLELNGQLAEGKQPPLNTSATFDAEFGRYRGWDQLLRTHGPYDDPTHRYGLGLTFYRSRLIRQAAQELERVAELVPENPLVRFWLARLYILNRFPERAVPMLTALRPHQTTLRQAGISQLEFLQSDVAALFAANKPELAQERMDDALIRNPDDQPLIETLIQVATATRHYTNALSAVERLLVLRPGDTNALFTAAYLQIQLGNHTAAIPLLNQVLAAQTNNHAARLNRAVSYLCSGQLERAKADYEASMKVYPNAFQVFYGLGEIAWRDKDTNAAVYNYQRYLTNAPPSSDEARMIRDRLEILRPGSSGTSAPPVSASAPSPP